MSAMMKWIGCLALAGLWLVSAAAAGAEPAVNENRDGRLTIEEWREFQASRRLAAEMGEEEARATRSEGDSGKRVPPTHAEIAYGPLPEQRLNLWIVPAEKPTPLIVHIHGGGFIQGGKQDTIDAAVHEKLIARGVSYASIQYRFQSADSPLPDVLRGIARSIQFLRFMASDWNLDKSRFGAFGSSAGAAASVWLGIRNDLADADHADPVLRESSRVQAVWAISVAATMDVWQWPKYNPLFSERMVRAWIARWGYDPDTDPNDPRISASRRELHFPGLASADDAPMVIVNEHFADNVAHNPHASESLYQICKKAGMDVRLYMREVVNNLDDAPDMFDWMIGRLVPSDSPAGRAGWGQELEAIRRSVIRGQPYGREAWVQQAAKSLGLASPCPSPVGHA
jgi:acetyl esterase/lipase